MLEIKGLSHRYADGTLSLDKVSFSLEKGQCLCVVGANGSGKSTLLELIATALKPDNGDILLNGVSLLEDVKNSRKKIGLVFQEPDDQLFMPSVWEDVAFGVMSKSVTPELGRSKAIEALSFVGAEHLADRVPHKLSGGEKCRVAIASILVTKPEVLLLDEPTASLDPRARRNIINLLKTLDATKLIATHDLAMAFEVADRAIFLHEGRLAGESGIPGYFNDAAFLSSIGL